MFFFRRSMFTLLQVHLDFHFLLIFKSLNFQFEKLKKKISPSLLGLETPWQQFQTNTFLWMALISLYYAYLKERLLWTMHIKIGQVVIK